VFAVTNFWEHLDPVREESQAARVADAARRAGVAHLVWSTLEDTRRYVPLDDPRMPTLMGHYKVPHCDAKGVSDARFAAAGVPTTRLYTSFYWENLLLLGMHPQRAADGTLVFTLPMGSRALPGIAVDDIGACVRTLFEQPQRWIGAQVGVAGAHLTGAQMAHALARVLGEPVRHHAPAFGEYAAFGFPGAAELANMFQFKHDFNDVYRAQRDVATARALHPGLQDFDTWLARHLPALRAVIAGADAGTAAAASRAA